MAIRAPALLVYLFYPKNDKEVNLLIPPFEWESLNLKVNKATYKKTGRPFEQPVALQMNQLLYDNLFTLNFS